MTETKIHFPEIVSSLIRKTRITDGLCHCYNIEEYEIKNNIHTRCGGKIDLENSKINKKKRKKKK